VLPEKIKTAAKASAPVKGGEEAEPKEPSELELVEDFEIAAPESIPGELPQAGAANESTPPPRPKEIEEAGGDSMLARYFREMATHAVMGQEEELATAIEVEKAEIDHWVSIFAHLPAAEHALDSLESDLPIGEEALTLPQIPELRKMLKNGRKAKWKISRAAEKRWLETCVSLARAIRLPDSDRLWIAHAEDIVRSLCETPDPDDDEHMDVQDSDVRLPDPAQLKPKIPPTMAYKKFLERIEIAAERSRIVKNKFVKANLRLVVSIARRYNPAGSR